MFRRESVADRQKVRTPAARPACRPSGYGSQSSSSNSRRHEKSSTRARIGASHEGPFARHPVDIDLLETTSSATGQTDPTSSSRCQSFRPADRSRLFRPTKARTCIKFAAAHHRLILLPFGICSFYREVDRNLGGNKPGHCKLEETHGAVTPRKADVRAIGVRCCSRLTAGNATAFAQGQCPYAGSRFANLERSWAEAFLAQFDAAWRPAATRSPALRAAPDLRGLMPGCRPPPSSSRRTPKDQQRAVIYFNAGLRRRCRTSRNGRSRCRAGASVRMI